MVLFGRGQAIRMIRIICKKDCGTGWSSSEETGPSRWFGLFATKIVVPVVLFERDQAIRMIRIICNKKIVVLHGPLCDCIISPLKAAFHMHNICMALHGNWACVLFLVSFLP